MRCIQCGADVKWRERRLSGGRCPRCKGRLVFDGKHDPHGMTDARFKAAVDRVSRDRGVFFTHRHLWLQLNRTRGWLGRGRIDVRIPYDDFKTKYLAPWVKAHGPIEGLLPERATPAPRTVPPDVAGFSFDRAIVTDRWDMAAMLVANRFHFEHNCAMLSADGYPDDIAGTVMEMLRRNPRLTVFALHDATAGGCMLPVTLRRPEWFPDWRTRVVDLGLRPSTVRRLRVPLTAGGWEPLWSLSRTLAPELERALPPEDVKWLKEAKCAELAAIRPAGLLRAVHRGIARAGPYDVLRMPDGWGSVDWTGYLGGSAPSDASVDTAAVDGFG